MSANFDRPITEIIKMRHSVRSYENKNIPEEIIEDIEGYISSLDNPFNIKIRVKLIKNEDLNGKLKLGTYGVIRGSRYFLAVSCEKEKFALQALGYTFEKLVLYCTSLGLGTVWLGGTFTRGTFAKAMNLKENEVLPIVSPLGYEGGEHSFLAKQFNKNTNKRKNYSEVFFNEEFSCGLTKGEAKEYAEVLEMVRLAPSATNKQPWRILKQGNAFHFYIEGSIKFKKIDIGIALCHFHLTALEKGLHGEFKIEEPKINNEFSYVISWIGL